MVTRAGRSLALEALYRSSRTISSVWPRVVLDSDDRPFLPGMVRDPGWADPGMAFTLHARFGAHVLTRVGIRPRRGRAGVLPYAAQLLTSSPPPTPQRPQALPDQEATALDNMAQDKGHPTASRNRPRPRRRIPRSPSPPPAATRPTSPSRPRAAKEATRELVRELVRAAPTSGSPALGATARARARPVQVSW